MRHIRTITTAALAGALSLSLGCPDDSESSGEACGAGTCGLAQRCVDGACVDTCASQAECRPSQECAGGLCVPRAPASSSSSHAGASSSAGGTTSSSAAGAPLGTPCTGDGECQSLMCRLAFGGSAARVCVAPCTRQLDCGPTGAFFCNPSAPDAAEGLCVPLSATHCADCSSDGDCGHGAERCLQVDGEPAPRCHVDCSIAGASACPTDYVCANVQVQGQVRPLCRPNTGRCDSAKGGSCERITPEQACTKVADAGRCTGVRICGTDVRYSACNATTPACKASCGQEDPPGCTLSVCPGSAQTAQDCGQCGRRCPGAGDPSAVAGCLAATCTFACAGEHYDVDGQDADGCEVADSPTGNHDEAHSHLVGSYGCSDGSSIQNLAGLLPNDRRTHEPAVAAMKEETGTSPDYLTIGATGGATCINDVELTLTVVSTSVPGCFRMTVHTNRLDDSCTTNASGTCAVSEGSGSYSGGTDIIVVVEKTCSSPGPEQARYHVGGHL